MGLLSRLRPLRCPQWAKSTVINRKKESFSPYVFYQIVLVHQNCIPDTLFSRFFNFFGTCPKYRKMIVHPGNFEHLREKFITRHGLLSEYEKNCFQVDDICQFAQKVSKLPLSELLEFIVFLNDINVNKGKNHYKALIRAIDNVCYEKIPKLHVEEAVRMNYCWLSVVGTEVKHLKSFNLLMDNFMNNMKENIKVPIIVLMLFCSGISRKDPKVKEIVVLGLNCICNNKKQMYELSISEVILICEVAFKTGSKVINPILIEHLVDTVAKDVPTFVKDPAHFVVIVKALRHNKNHNWNLLKSIQNCLLEDEDILKTYSFAGKTHLIALYADALCGDQEFFNYLIDSAIRSTFEQDVYNPYNEKGKGRAKDIARLLWATSYLGFQIKEDVLEKDIMPIITTKNISGVYRKQLSVLVDTILSLWIMGYKPVNLLPFVYTEEMKKYLSEINRVRYKARLQLLSTCVSIESPEITNGLGLEKFFMGNPYNPREEKLLQQRPFLKRVFQDVRNAVFMSGSMNVRCENSLPYLNIAGILLTTNNNPYRKSIHIEVFDNTNCLHETDIPTGLMLLKLRLLRKLGHKLIVINHNDYGNQKSQIMAQIEDEIMDIQGS